MIRFTISAFKRPSKVNTSAQHSLRRFSEIGVDYFFSSFWCRRVESNVKGIWRRLAWFIRCVCSLAENSPAPLRLEFRRVKHHNVFETVICAWILIARRITKLICFSKIASKNVRHVALMLSGTWGAPPTIVCSRRVVLPNTILEEIEQEYAKQSPYTRSTESRESNRWGSRYGIESESRNSESKEDEKNDEANAESKIRSSHVAWAIAIEQDNAFDSSTLVDRSCTAVDHLIATIAPAVFILRSTWYRAKKQEHAWGLRMVHLK